MDRWLGDVRLLDVSLSPPPINLLQDSVRSYWDTATGWKWHLFTQFLPATSLLQLASVSLSEDDGEQDTLSWIPSPQKSFTIKSAHSLEAGWASLPTRRVWDLIWHLKVYERIKVFLWELCHSRLLTNDSRWRRGLSSSPDCTRCSGGSEDCLHLMRDCGDAVEVWKQLLPPSLIQKFFTLPLDTWLEWNLSGKDFTFFSPCWPECLANVCWRQWKWRNDFVFNHNIIPTEVKMMTLHSVFESSGLLSNSGSSYTCPGSPFARVLQVCWKPPSPSFIKVNVEGLPKQGQDMPPLDASCAITRVHGLQEEPGI